METLLKEEIFDFQEHMENYAREQHICLSEKVCKMFYRLYVQGGHRTVDVTAPALPSKNKTHDFIQPV